MCNACGNPAAPGHWTEAGAASAGDRLRMRFRRQAVLNALLRPYGLSVHDDGLVPGLQLATLSGAVSMVQHLDDLWTEAERLAGRPVDPLDPRWLAADA